MVLTSTECRTALAKVRDNGRSEGVATAVCLKMSSLIPTAYLRKSLPYGISEDTSVNYRSFRARKCFQGVRAEIRYILETHLEVSASTSSVIFFEYIMKADCVLYI